MACRQTRVLALVQPAAVAAHGPGSGSGRLAQRVITIAALRRHWKRRVWMHFLRLFHPEIAVPLGYGSAVVDLRDHGISRRLYMHREYEPALQSLIMHMELGGRQCVDIGANIGVHTLLMSRAVGPTGTVFAFEPDPRNAHLLQATLRMNGARNVVVQR